MSLGSFLKNPFSYVKDKLKEAWDDLREFTEESLRILWENVFYKEIEFVMNLLGFEDETVYSIQVITTRLIPEEQQNGLSFALAEAITQNQSITDRIKFTILSGPVGSLGSYVSYGKNVYIHGLPTAISAFTVLDEDAVDVVITGIVGEPITILASSLTLPPDEYWVKYYLQENEGYEEWVGEITVASVVWLYDGFTENATTGEFTVHLKRFTTVWVYSDYPTLIGPAESKTYYNVKYSLDSAPGEYIYWEYLRELGTYPSLDASAQISEDETNTVPIVPLRKNFISVKEGDEAYPTSKTLLTRIGLNFDDIVASIEENPDIDQIEDAFILFAINLYTESNIGKQYLYYYFLNIYQHADVSQEQYEAGKDSDTPPVNVISIKEQSFNASILFNYINFADNTGSIGSVGTVDIEITVLANTPPDPETGLGGGVNSYVTIRAQYDDNEYIQLEVHGLIYMSNVLTVAGEIKSSLIQLSTNVDDMNNFIIPMPYAILDEFSYTEKEALLYEALTLEV